MATLLLSPTEPPMMAPAAVPPPPRSPSFCRAMNVVDGRISGRESGSRKPGLKCSRFSLNYSRSAGLRSALLGFPEVWTRRAAPIRVVIADDDPIVRDLLRTVVLRRSPNIELVGEAGDGAEAIKLVCQLKPQILLLDLLMPLLPGMDTLRELASAPVSVRTVVLCAAIDSRQIVKALQLGARGILLKKSLTHFTTCIDAVMSGNYWVEDRKLSSVAEVVGELMSTSTAEPETGQKYKLTNRELQVISLVSFGNTNREIGRTLNISEETVKRHLANIFNKVGMSTRLELVIFAVEHRIVSL